MKAGVLAVRRTELVVTELPQFHFPARLWIDLTEAGTNSHIQSLQPCTLYEMRLIGDTNATGKGGNNVGSA
jgi:hypothetical protein